MWSERKNIESWAERRGSKLGEAGQSICSSTQSYCCLAIGQWPSRPGWRKVWPRSTWCWSIPPQPAPAAIMMMINMILFQGPESDNIQPTRNHSGQVSFRLKQSCPQVTSIAVVSKRDFNNLSSLCGNWSSIEDWVIGFLGVILPLSEPTTNLSENLSYVPYVITESTLCFKTVLQNWHNLSWPKVLSFRHLNLGSTGRYR